MMGTTGRVGGLLRPILPATLLVVVVIVNRLGIPEWVATSKVKTYMLVVLSANLLLLAVCIELAVASIARWTAGDRPRGPGPLFADALPILLLAAYGGVHLVFDPLFYTGIYNYLTLMGG